jgi:hypothetical protein
MPIKWKKEIDNLVVFTVTGQLDMTEYINAQQQVMVGGGQSEKVRVLIQLDNFAGWAPDKGWGDVSSAEQVDPYIERMAIVGEPQWEGMVSAFTLKGLRPFPIEYFATRDEPKARQWLAGAD